MNKHRTFAREKYHFHIIKCMKLTRPEAENKEIFSFYLYFSSILFVVVVVVVNGKKVTCTLYNV